MARSSRFSDSTLGVREQLARMRQVYPHFSLKVRAAKLIVNGNLQPTERSESYHFRLEYEVGRRPEVNVISPELRLRDPEGKLPHTFSGRNLCLYLPNMGEWTENMSLASTIIPWTAEWLFYYEVWYVTGDWCGGGVEPSNIETIRNS